MATPGASVHGPHWNHLPGLANELKMRMMMIHAPGGFDYNGMDAIKAVADGDILEMISVLLTAGSSILVEYAQMVHRQAALETNETSYAEDFLSIAAKVYETNLNFAKLNYNLMEQVRSAGLNSNTLGSQEMADHGVASTNDDADSDDEFVDASEDYPESEDFPEPPSSPTPYSNRQNLEQLPSRHSEDPGSTPKPTNALLSRPSVERTTPSKARGMRHHPYSSSHKLRDRSVKTPTPSKSAGKPSNSTDESAPFTRVQTSTNTRTSNSGPEYMDISSEVEARLLAKRRARAAARGPAVGKRKRDLTEMYIETPRKRSGVEIAEVMREMRERISKAGSPSTQKKRGAEDVESDDEDTPKRRRV